MARVVAVSWFPRTYINLFETYIGIDKIALKIKDPVYAGRSLSFTITDLPGYPEVTFTQGWGGLHYFVVELPDAGIAAAADKFMKDMQNVLLEKILRACHSVPYKPIVADTMPLASHVLVLSCGDIDPPGMKVSEAGELRVAYKPADIYYSGTATYVMGADDAELIAPLLFHAYAEVASSFLYNQMKAMIRLFHSAGSTLEDIEGDKEQKELKGDINVLEGIISESAGRRGKMKHVVLNIKLKIEEYEKASWGPQGYTLAEALEIPACLERLKADGDYMDILWDEIMGEKMRDVGQQLRIGLKMRGQQEKKGWL
jgi:hypothetical protein